MEIEYSTEVRGRGYAYRFQPWEKMVIAKLLPLEIKKIEKKIAKIENDPNNEGQVTYSEKIREHRSEIRCLTEIIQEFKKNN